MTRRVLAAFMLAAVAQSIAAAQDVSKEYRVKATFLYNFVKFVEWPTRAAGPIVICVAGRNPFGSFLADTVRGESVQGRTIEIRAILEPDPACHMVFLAAAGAATPAYLRAAIGTPTLTVGEAPGFIQQGGLIRFYLDVGTVRFEINREAAERSGIRISARLLQLARIVPVPSGAQ